ncbi:MULTISPECIES: dihydrolipoyl dehydrogenase family protein [unclassified Modestobacter]|uniref:dihydrolipoyl dehydrogenase family protein n=1 Tax=unclassified Modestobacter TaxID=2643866 RepID=UPI0022AA200C|nr:MULTISPECIES: NAD(P)/FAD-dependent oxidoreductase [unclassified Modestobacter]MCZ2824466.1 NAD(P)/FAD-dependent oxidoreductase [Modestobacter sp. VKM Ac-2981]MCZ2854006.1 NAD(P)/FAD-dependent oxidoreductase [Modestobacter sp. VKM Ac-2982]
MTTAEQTYDVIVLGAGSTGENVADIATRGGLSVVLVESELVGGECSYWACMPSKALLRGSEALAQARAVSGAAAAVTGEQDVAATLARRDGFTSHWDDAGQATWVEGAGITLVRGHGRLAGEKRIVVAQEDGTELVLTARHAIAVCTGSRGAVPPVEGLADVQPWTPREATSAKEAPGRLLVLGGGYVGSEMATAWQQLGSSVTLLQRGHRLLPNLEPAAGAAVEASLREMGVDVRLGSEVRSARREDGGDVVLSTADGEFRGDEVLVATGRAANTDEVGLETVGLEPGGYLDVDESLQVPGLPWLYGVGDVNGRQQLTHMGKYQARQAGAAIVARARGEQVDLADWSPFVATADRRATPSVVFTEPQVGSVGMTAAQAADAGVPHRVVEYAIGGVAGAALFADGYSGTAIAVVDTEREVLLGVTFVGPGVAELLHSATIAVVGEVPISRLWHAVPSYPTISEIWLRLLETYRG